MCIFSRISSFLDNGKFATHPFLQFAFSLNGIVWR